MSTQSCHHSKFYFQEREDLIITVTTFNKVLQQLIWLLSGSYTDADFFHWTDDRQRGKTNYLTPLHACARGNTTYMHVQCWL